MTDGYNSGDAYKSGEGGGSFNDGETIFKGLFDRNVQSEGSVYLTIPAALLSEGDVVQASIQSKGSNDNIGTTTYIVGSPIGNTVRHEESRTGTFNGTNASFNSGGPDLELIDFGASTPSHLYEYAVRLVRQSSLAGGNGVQSVVGSAAIEVDSSDPENPIVKNTGVHAVIAESGIEVDNSNPLNPTIKNIGVHEIIAGTNVSVNNANPLKPVVSAAGGSSELLGIATMSRNRSEAQQILGGGIQGTLSMSVQAPLQATRIDTMGTIVLQGDASARGRFVIYKKQSGLNVFDLVAQTAQVLFNAVGEVTALIEGGEILLDPLGNYFHGIVTLGSPQFLRYRGFAISVPNQIAHDLTNVWNQPVPDPVPSSPVLITNSGSSSADTYFIASFKA